MFRACHFVVLCLAILMLRTANAQQAVDPYGGGVRTQGADPQQNLPGTYSSAIPNDMRFQGPVQPMPVSRPVNWPGTPVDSSTGPTNSPAPAPAPSRAGVKVWDPSSNQSAPTQPSQNQPAAYQTPASAPANPTTYPSAAANPQTYPATSYPPAATVPNPYAATPPAYTQTAGATPPTYPQMASVAPTPTYPATGYSAASVGNTSALQAAAQPASPASPQADPLAAAQNLQILPGPPQDYPDAQVAGRIGSEVVLVGDLKAMAGDMLVQRKVQIPKGQEAEFYEQANRQILKQLIETKLVFNDAMHTIPAAGLSTMETKVNEYFDKDQLPELFKLYGASTRQELDAKLREHGNSLDRTRKQFFERTVAKEWLRSQVKLDEEVPHAEVLGYYQQHLPDYEFPAKSRWEELMVRFDRFPNKEAAYAAAAEMGNLAMRGAPFAEVAKTRSQGATADSGGAHDWTTKGSLVSKTLDDTLFTLPTGTFSQIIETERGFHIVRVLERKDAGRISFVDAQGEIKKKLKDESVKKQISKYLDDLRQKTPVTTMYDNQPGGFDGANKTAQSGP